MKIDDESSHEWKEVKGSDGHIWELTIAEDPETGDYTRLTKFKNGYSTDTISLKQCN